MFGVFCVLMFIHVFFMFPETAGKTLEEVEDLFTDPHGLPHIGTPAWKTKITTKRALLLEKGELDAEKATGHLDESPDRRETAVRHEFKA